MSEGVTAVWRILVLHGPNLELTGARQPELYGSETLGEINAATLDLGKALGAIVDVAQFAAEEELTAAILAAAGRYDGLIINPAVYTHTSPALARALRTASIPYVEVHLSNPYAREPARHRSYVADGAVGRVMGFRGDSYLLALRGLVAYLARSPRARVR